MKNTLSIDQLNCDFFMIQAAIEVFFFSLVTARFFPELHDYQLMRFSMLQVLSQKIFT